MDDPANRTPADAARAELAAAGIIVAPERAAAARRRRLDLAESWRGRARTVRRRVRATMRGEQPPGDASRHTAA